MFFPPYGPPAPRDVYKRQLLRRFLRRLLLCRLFRRLSGRFLLGFLYLCILLLYRLGVGRRILLRLGILGVKVADLLLLPGKDVYKRQL